MEAIIQHCDANLELLRSMDVEKGLPARMHFDKMTMFETGMIFENSIGVNTPTFLRIYFIQIRVVIRNIDLELLDIIAYFYRAGPFRKEELAVRIRYQIEKIEYAKKRLEYILNQVKRKTTGPAPKRSSEIIYCKDNYN